MTRRFSVVGLGKLGASMTAAIASRGFEVVGVDVVERSVELVNEGRAPVQETGLDEMLAASRARIRGTTDVREAVLESDVTFVVVPTPSDERGAFSLEYAYAAFQKIGEALGEKDGYHLVVMTSTVLPGGTRYGLVPLLEQGSGKVCGPDFGVCYSPEFIALGSVIRDFLNPDFTLIGQFDERSGELLEECYAAIVQNGAPSRRMSIENAELAKIAVNTYVTTKITFANMLSELCELIPGGDVDVVTNALGSDLRIGHKYLKGALGYGGPCFPRDNVALSFMAQALGTRAHLAEATDFANRSLAHSYAERLQESIPAGSVVAVLGLSYKPHSHVVEESQGVALARAVARGGHRVVCYDPLAMESARGVAPELLMAESVRSCLADADVVLVTTPDPEFVGLTPEDFPKRDRGVMVIDFWRILDRALSDMPGINYVPVGRGRDEMASAELLRDLWSPPLQAMAAG